MSKITNILDKPKLGLSLWSAYHLIIWTLLPLFCNTCLPLDSIEAVMWGSQWQWGYDKHPPLSAWTPELMSDVMGDAGVYLLSQVCIVLAGIGIYRLGRLLKLTKKQSLVAVLLLDTIYYYQFISVEFNVNILQMPFWAWAWYFGMDAVENRRMRSWLGLGICVALGALTKYIAVFLLAPLFAIWWARGELKKVLMSSGIYIAGGVSILLFLPHLVWMRNHDWITITYGLQRGENAAAHWWYHLWNPLGFLLTQAAIVAPVILVAIIAHFRSPQKPTAERTGATTLALGAFAAIALLSLATGMKLATMWAAPMPLAIGLWLVPRFKIDRFPRTVMTTIVLMSTAFVTVYALLYGFGPHFNAVPHRINYPGEALAQAVEARWHEKQEEPLAFVIGDEFLGGIVNHYGKDEPAVMIRGSLEQSTYLTEEQVQEKGAIIVWLKSYVASSSLEAPLEVFYPDMRQRYPNLQLEPDEVIPWPRRADHKAGRYGIAYIPPKK